ncbi:MAG: hypothetical protein WKG07_41775 [Hymenobacter sp.]
MAKVAQAGYQEVETCGFLTRKCTLGPHAARVQGGAGGPGPEHIQRPLRPGRLHARW